MNIYNELERQRQRDRDRETERAHMYVCMRVFICVCLGVKRQCLNTFDKLLNADRHGKIYF